MPQIVFRFDEYGDPAPCLPAEPDGQTRFSLADAAAKSGLSVERLRARYLSTFGPLLESAGRDVDSGKPIEPTPSSASPDASSPASHDEDASAESTDTGVALDAAACRSVQDDLIRALHFPDLEDEDFARVKLFARAGQYDLVARQVWATRLHDGDDERLIIGLSIEGFRCAAHRTGRYAGISRPSFIFRDGDDPQDPASVPAECSVTVYRLVDGSRCPFEATVYHAELYGAGTKYRNDSPRGWLAKCAEAAALRKAFPNELGGVYSPEEMGKVIAAGSRPLPPRRPPVGAKIDDPSIEWDEPRPVTSTLDADGREVTTRNAFMLALVTELGVRDEAERTVILHRAMTRLKNYLSDEAAFYAKAIEDVRKNAKAYGLPVRAA